MHSHKERITANFSAGKWEYPNRHWNTDYSLASMVAQVAALAAAVLAANAAVRGQVQHTAAVAVRVVVQRAAQIVHARVALLAAASDAWAVGGLSVAPRWCCYWASARCVPA